MYKINKANFAPKKFSYFESETIFNLNSEQLVIPALEISE